MLIAILMFISGCIVTLVALTALAKRYGRKSVPAAPVSPSREDLIACVEHLRDRLRTIEDLSEQRTLTELAKRAQAQADQVLKGDTSQS